ncbi:MAG: efflux RND transporter periplasmic adaptor subunit [Chromatiales bacterium]|nr:efflux RND transporter periplasmic adaptor subunit [Chromatiales bacterium]
MHPSPLSTLPATLGILLLAAATAGGQSASRSGAPPDLPAVTAVRAGSAGVAQQLRFTGTVTAERDAALSARVSGLVAAVRVDAGDRVKRGAALLDLDPALAELSLAQSRGALGEAKARRAEQERLRDDAAALVASSNIARTQALAAAAEANIAAAVVARLEAEVSREAELVARHRLVAPFDGVVRRRLVDVGEWVDTSTPVLELVSLAPVRLDVQVPQENFGAISADQPVSVQLDALPGDSFNGRVIARVPASDLASRTFLVRVVIDGADGRVIPGMSGQAAFRLPAAAGTATVPQDAVIRGSDGSTRLWTVTTSGSDPGTGRVSARVVKLGRSGEGRVEVREGLPAGSLVVVRGNEGLREGQDVRLLPGN